MLEASRLQQRRRHFHAALQGPRGAVGIGCCCMHLQRSRGMRLKILLSVVAATAMLPSGWSATACRPGECAAQPNDLADHHSVMLCAVHAARIDGLHGPGQP